MRIITNCIETIQTKLLCFKLKWRYWYLNWNKIYQSGFYVIKSWTFDNDHHTIHQQDSFCTMLMKIKPYAYCPIQIWIVLLYMVYKRPSQDNPSVIHSINHREMEVNGHPERVWIKVQIWFLSLVSPSGKNRHSKDKKKAVNTVITQHMHNKSISYYFSENSSRPCLTI